jgi:transcriptional regulator with GAF, ATPase, and Fis domain
MPSLVLFPRPGVRTRLINIYRRITTLGCATDNDVVLEDGDIRPNHCQIFYDGKTYLVSSLDKDGDVYVNGKKTRKQQLADQDVLRIGKCTLQFSLLDIPTDEFTSQDIGARDSVRKLMEFTAALVEERNLENLLNLMLDKLIELSGADRGFVFLLDGDRATLHAARNMERDAIGVSDAGFSDSIVRHVLSTGQPLLVSDALNDAQFRMSQSVVNLKLCSVMCAPMTARGETVGVLYLGNDNVVNLFEESTLDVVQVFATQAALLVRNAVLINELQLGNRKLHEQLEEIKFGRIIGSSQAMRDLFKRIEKVATTDIGVLIRGETGTGKELVAHELHTRSSRAAGPFVAINCGAIPENLLESELFGHEKGAYTGAHAAAPGKFQSAHKGTLLLDEIGDLPYALQAKILRAIEHKQVVRVGGTRAEDVNIRILAATNKNLEEAVARNEFRQDLYFRLNVVTLTLPPLREREQDVQFIANYFLQRFTTEYNSKVRGFSPAAVAAIAAHTWPGNVRELENKVRKGVVLCDRDLLEPEDLELQQGGLQVLPLADAREKFQKDYVQKVLDINKGNKAQTARDLGVDPRTIFRYLEKEREEEQ